jgi:CHAT domain-containing protein/predicted negative regulator of RcsB-dependent stress response
MFFFPKGLSDNLPRRKPLSPAPYRCVFILLTHLICAFAVGAQTKYLEPGQPLAQEIAPKQKQSFRIKIAANNFFRISVRQQPGVDLILSLFDGRHRKLAAVGGYRGFLKMENTFPFEAYLDIVSLAFVADYGGIYEIELDAGDSPIRGRYEIEVKDARQATATDRKRVEAERFFESGERLRFPARSREDLRLALKRYENALAIYREISDVAGQAAVFDAMCLTQGVLQNLEKAAEYAETAVKLYRSTGDRARTAHALAHLAGIRHARQEEEKLVAASDEILQIWRELGDKRNEARALLGYPMIVRKPVDDPNYRLQVIETYLRAANMFRELDSPSEEARALFQLAAFYTYISEDEKSIEIYEQALRILKPLGYKRYIVFALLRVGEHYYDRGDYQNAFDYYSEALEYSSNTNTNYEAYTLYNLSNSTLTLDKKKVFEYLNRALPIWEGNRNGEAYTMVSIGRYYFSEGQTREALDYYARALPMMRGSGDMYGVGIILMNIGETYFAAGDKTKAVEYYRQALELHRAARNRRDEARTLIRLGTVHQSAGETEKVFLNFSEALKLYRAIGNRSGEAGALYALARAERGRGNLAAARAFVEQTLRIVEALRAGIAGEELRSAYFSSVQQYYEFYVDLLMTLHDRLPDEGFDRLALEAAERGRARNLLELLAASRVDLRRGVDKALIDRETDLQKKLDAKSAERLRMLVESHGGKQAAAVEKEIEELTNDLQMIKSRISSASPRLAQLSQTNTLKTPEIQNLLDDDTVLLEYALGDERSFLWLVTTRGVKSFVLPNRAEIEKTARRVYESLTARNKKIKGETERQAQNRFAAADEEFQNAARDLSRLLLDPVAPLPLDRKRLLIVADGALQYVPFAALPSPRSRVESREPESNQDSRLQTPDPRRFLVETNEIVNLPSASTLAILRREAVKHNRAPLSVAVLADPVFSRKDERVSSAASNRTPSAAKNSSSAAATTEIKFSTQRALFDFGFGGRAGIPRLPFSRREAETIVSLAPANSWLKALDFEASRATATGGDLSRYRIVHFATHGLLNSSHPELSGLLFSLIDERGDPQNGFLPLQEIYNLRLNADLVVLSACQTGLGKEIRGEGLVGLTRGFMFAGSSRVAASLWKVDDAATAELMRHFYRAMLQEKRAPAAALRAAQIRMLKERGDWHRPYFWAAFVVQGEWK